MSLIDAYRKAASNRVLEAYKAAFEDIIPIYINEFSFTNIVARDQDSAFRPSLWAIYKNPEYPKIQIELSCTPNQIKSMKLFLVHSKSMVESKDITNESEISVIVTGWKPWIEKNK